MTPFYRHEGPLTSNVDLKALARAAGLTIEETARAIKAERLEAIAQKEEVWLNDLYQVFKRDMGDIWYLSIKRLDKDAIHDWRHLQEIKNALCGDECEGLEIYPAESRKVDGANQYHMFVFKDPAYRIPFGFQERRVTDAPIPGTRQRPLEKGAL